MESELSCKERSPCKTFSTRLESTMSRMPCMKDWIAREEELSAFVYILRTQHKHLIGFNLSLALISTNVRNKVIPLGQKVDQ